MQRRYITENIINCRDLGGYACKSGVTSFGRAIRCGIPKNPTSADIEILKNLGIKTVIDLRGNAEAQAMPSYFKDNKDFDYHHYSLLEANPALARDNSDILELYKFSLENHGENYACILRLISSLNEPFLFHCFLGKDRTGILAALLLSAAGVSKEDIIADYQVTYTYIIDFFRKEISSGSGLIWETNEENIRSQPEKMERLLDYIGSRYGGAENYFRSIGLTDDEISGISAVLS